MTDAGRPPPATACRPYRIGDHSRALRGHLLRSMLLAVIIAALASVVLPIGVAMAIPNATGRAISGWAAVVTLPVTFTLAHWALVGPRRWEALEILIWGGGFSAAAYAATTGIRNPTDRAAAAAWLAEHPPRSQEDPATTYWRAYSHVLADDPDAARSAAGRLEGIAGYEFARAELVAQIDLSEGRPVDVGSVEAAVRAIEDPFARAVAAASLGALGAQLAWTCGRDDVAPVLAVRPLTGREPRWFLLRHYWLPFVAVTAASALVFSIVRPFG